MLGFFIGICGSCKAVRGLMCFHNSNWCETLVVDKLLHCAGFCREDFYWLVWVLECIS